MSSWAGRKRVLKGSFLNPKLHHGDRRARRGSKKGIMEWWNNGIMGRKQKTASQHSILSISQLICSVVIFFFFVSRGRRDFQRKKSRVLGSAKSIDSKIR
jgi:hypothetical protein